jgi:hypothetical protein
MVIADLQCPHPFVGHMAVGTGNAGAGMNSLVPKLKLGMLGF